MDGFNLLKTFLEVANVGSFSRAAGKLGIQGQRKQACRDA